jgi:acyl-CoA synthetase (AMP-forming)/AMP-acid ligase II/alkanesulfonate monooxygenase SsuD/methylene tetrahydromethanopterin reductase-like flavin-dependent oxidoreductase (luciferase family)/acyl carrier protein/GNAT superfamily N-acetyltransferase
MKFGIFLPLQSPRPWDDRSPTRLIAEALEQAELADRLGYDCVWAQEHHFLEEYSHSSAPETLLAAISQRTRQIRIGHGVMLMLPGYNHPVRCAERIAMLDQISGGRVEWGTGASGTPTELEAFGIDPSQKHAMWREGVQQTVRLLTEEPYSGYEGRFVRIPRRNLVPKPIQRPHPPLWMACSNREALRHAAKMGVGALTFAFINAQEAKHWVDEYYATAAAGCQPIGAAVNLNVAMLSNFFCHRDREKALALGREGAEFFAYGLRHYFRGDSPHEAGGRSLWQSFVETRERPFVNLERFNTPEALADHYRALEEVGVDQVILLQQAGGYRHEEVCASLELFAAAVLPEFKLRDAAPVRSKERRLNGRDGATPTLNGSRPYAIAAGSARQMVATAGTAPAMNGHARAMEQGAMPASASAESPVAPTKRQQPAARRADCRNLVDLLLYRAAERPMHRALCELDERGAARRHVTYQALADRVEHLALRLQPLIRSGDRVLAIGETGIEFAASLLAVMRAGGVVVPAPAIRSDRRSARLDGILHSAQPAAVLGSRADLDALAAIGTGPGSAAALPSVTIDETPLAGGLPAARRETATLALIHYTSGSTQEPKGVAISHEALLTSLGNTENVLGYSDADRFLTIMPLYHTFSLMVHCWSALWTGAPCYLVAPLAVASEPLVWLDAISRHQVTVSGSANFAYERCARVPAGQGIDLDLSSWRLALNGGEPPQLGTIQAFTSRWRQNGFLPSAMTPSYGSTEATGTVTGHRASVGPVIAGAGSGNLAHDLLRHRDRGKSLVSSGQASDVTEIRIVDPQSRAPCPDGATGEIWLRGPTIATGYFGENETSEAAERFGVLVTADGGQERYLRTGDLGALFEGELYVTGRLKDVIIAHGEKFYPADIEAIVHAACPSIAANGVAAIGLPGDGTERVALLVELPTGRGDLDEDTIRSAVTQRLGVRISRICCVGPGELPKTPMGKLKRLDCRRLLEEGALDPTLDIDDAGSAVAGKVCDIITKSFEHALKRGHIPPTRTFFELGGDSLLAAEVIVALNSRFGTDISLSEIVDDFSVGAMAALVGKRQARAKATGRTGRPEKDTPVAVLARLDDYDVEVLGEQHVEEAVQCLVQSFARLPMVQALGPAPEEAIGFVTGLAGAAAEQGLSLAVTHRPSGRLVACGICDNYAEILAADPPPLPESLLPALAIQSHLDRRYIEATGMPSARTLHMNLLAVDREHEGMNLPARIIEATLDFALARGFKAAIAHAASPVVQLLLRNEYGFVPVAVQRFSDYEVEGMRPFAAVPGAGALMLMTRPLRDWKPRHLGLAAIADPDDDDETLSPERPGALQRGRALDWPDAGDACAFQTRGA